MTIIPLPLEPPTADDDTTETHPEGWWLASDGNWYPPQDVVEAPKRKRNWKKILLRTAVVLVIIALSVSTFIGFKTASQWHDRKTAETSRADGLQTDLNTTKDNLAQTVSDLSETESKLSSVKSSLAERSADLTKLKDATQSCVTDFDSFLNDLSAIVGSYGYYSGNDALATRVGTECGQALVLATTLSAGANA